MTPVRNPTDSKLFLSLAGLVLGLSVLGLALYCPLTATTRLNVATEINENSVDALCEPEQRTHSLSVATSSEKSPADALSVEALTEKLATGMQTLLSMDRSPDKALLYENVAKQVETDWLPNVDLMYIIRSASEPYYSKASEALQARLAALVKQDLTRRLATYLSTDELQVVQYQLGRTSHQGTASEVEVRFQLSTDTTPVVITFCWRQTQPSMPPKLVDLKIAQISLLLEQNARAWRAPLKKGGLEGLIKQLEKQYPQKQD